MVPLIENKGSIILAAALDLKWYIAYLGTSLGTFLPVPFLLRNSRKKLARLRRFGPIASIMAHVLWARYFCRAHIVCLSCENRFR